MHDFYNRSSVYLVYIICLTSSNYMTLFQSHFRILSGRKIGNFCFIFSKISKVYFNVMTNKCFIATGKPNINIIVCTPKEDRKGVI